MVTDLTGSTSLLEKMGTEAWVTLMNLILRILEGEINRFGGKVHQFRGDGLVAVFGMTSAHEDDPERAVLAGLAMQRSFTTFAAEMRKSQEIDLRLRVGISTGEVIITSVGNRYTHEEDSTMGKAVATASRLESAAEPGTVLVSEDTSRLASAQFKWQNLGTLPALGNSPSLNIYRPMAPVKSNLTNKQVFGCILPIVGRDTEYQTIMDCVKCLFDYRGKIVTLSGERGMGKSFLISEVYHHFARETSLIAETHNWQTPDEKTITWYQVRCHSYDQLVPYSMWVDLLLSWLEMGQDDTPEVLRTRLRNKSESLWSEETDAYYPYLAAFLSLPLEESCYERVKYLDANGLQQQFFAAIRSWIQAMVRQSPLVLVFSDMNWSDSSGIELIKHCLPLTENESLLWIFTFQPERDSPMIELQHYLQTNYPHRLVSLTLTPITAEQSGDYIDHLIGQHTLPDEIRSLIIKKAAGNPYFIEELIHSLILRGVLDQDINNGRWYTTRKVSTLDLPDSLHTLLTAQIDQLSPEERFTLQMASIIGTDFWFNALQALIPETNVLKKNLASLQRDLFITERDQIPELGKHYTFKSSLLRDSAYESLLADQRRSAHRKAAEYLENTLNIDFFLQHFGLLAYQYAQAKNTRKELFYTLQFAEQVKKVYANEEALELYNRSISLLDELTLEANDPQQKQIIQATRFEILKNRIDVFELMGRMDDRQTDSVALLNLAQELSGDPVWLIDAILLQPGVATWQNKDECLAGVPLAEKAFQLAQQVQDLNRQLNSLAAITEQRIFLSDPHWHESGEKALELARQIKDQAYETRLLILLGSTYSWSDQPDRGMDYLKAALPLCESLDDRISLVDLLNQIGLIAERQGDYYRLLNEFHEKRLKTSQNIGYRHGVVSALTACGQVQAIYLGDYEGGVTWLEAAKQKSIRLQEVIPAELRTVQIMLALGKFDSARDILEKLQGTDETGSFHNIRASLRLLRAMYHNSCGCDSASYLAALESVSQVNVLMAEIPMISRQYAIAARCQAAISYLKLARCLVDAEPRREYLKLALESSQSAVNLYESFGFMQIIECTSEEVLFVHSQVLAENAYLEESNNFLSRAYVEMERKLNLIPPGNYFHRSYLENIPIHREIRVSFGSLENSR